MHLQHVASSLMQLITGFLASRLGNLQVDLNPDLWAPQTHAYVETTNQLDGGRLTRRAQVTRLR